MSRNGTVRAYPISTILSRRRTRLGCVRYRARLCRGCSSAVGRGLRKRCQDVWRCSTIRRFLSCGDEYQGVPSKVVPAIARGQEPSPTCWPRASRPCAGDNWAPRWRRRRRTPHRPFGIRHARERECERSSRPKTHAFLVAQIPASKAHSPIPSAFVSESPNDICLSDCRASPLGDFNDLVSNEVGLIARGPISRDIGRTRI